MIKGSTELKSGKLRMNTIEIILFAVITVAGGFMAYFSYLHLKEKIENAGRRQISFLDEARYNKKLDEIMFTLEHELHASTVFLARFHNNGYWSNGRCMKKFTVMLEKSNPTYPSLMQDFRDVLCSRYPEAMDFLLFYHTYQQADLSICKDQNLKRDFMTKLGYSSLYLFLIEQANGEMTPEAFIGVLYKGSHVLSREHADLIKSKRFEILGLLNMTKKG